MKVLKHITNFLIIFILIFSICILTMTYCYEKFVNKEYVKQTLTQSQYYDKLSLEFNEKVLEYVGPSGIDEHIFENLTTPEDIEKDTNTVLNIVFDGTEDKIDTSIVSQRLMTNLENDNEYSKLINSNKEQIEQLASHIEKDYSKYILNLNFEKVNKILEQTNPIVQKTSQTLKILIIICVLLEIVLNLKHINVGIANIGVSLMSSSVILFVSKIYVGANINIENISVYTKAISDGIKTYISNVLNYMNKISIIYFITALIIILIASVIKAISENSKMKENKN